MVNNRTPRSKNYKKTKHKKTKHKKTKHRKNIRKLRDYNFTKRLQIGCSNKRDKVMMGGGVNPISQPLDNLNYSTYGSATNAYNTLFGYSPQPSSNMSEQPYLS